jgi:hypothetical protein
VIGYLREGLRRSAPNSQAFRVTINCWLQMRTFDLIIFNFIGRDGGALKNPR